MHCFSPLEKSSNKEKGPSFVLVSLLDLVCCPQCRAGEWRIEAKTDVDIEEGRICCGACGAAYVVREGMLDLNPAPSAAAQQEMSGQRILADRWLEDIPASLHPLVEGEAGLHLMRSLPRCTHPALAEAVPSLKRLDDIAEDYFELLGWLGLRGDEVIVELGANIGWHARHLAKCGARVVATDIGHQLALARNYFDGSIYFERVFCDMMALPFREGSLDLITAVATIHHADDLAALFRACRRALKAGGRAVFFAEPVVGAGDADARERFGAQEKAIGIQEHVYSIDEYFGAAQAAGFRARVIPLRSLLHDSSRRWPLARALGRLILASGLGYTDPFTRRIYPLLLRRYPRIPFPNFALALD